jgi:hypothetical protein
VRSGAIRLRRRRSTGSPGEINAKPEALVEIAACTGNFGESSPGEAGLVEIAASPTGHQRDEPGPAPPSSRVFA